MISLPHSLANCRLDGSLDFSNGIIKAIIFFILSDNLFLGYSSEGLSLLLKYAL
jgi:hypothetical protein